MSETDTLNIAVVGACPFPVPQGSQIYLRDSALSLPAYIQARENVHGFCSGFVGVPLVQVETSLLQHDGSISTLADVELTLVAFDADGGQFRKFGKRDCFLNFIQQLF